MNPKHLLITLPLTACSGAQVAQHPNIIIILTDDQGYQDVGCYGSPDIKTPNIDRMASEGLRLTDFYQSSSVSSASRAGLLTGRLNSKNGVPNVYFPTENGMPLEEVTIAEVLKAQGYATACFGKWHLGDAQEHMPLNQGFDEYFGIPYSNDMYITPLIPLAQDVVLLEDYTLEMAQRDQDIAGQGRRAAFGNKLRNSVPLVDGGEIVEYPCDQSTLTRRYFDRAIDFVLRSKEAKQPLFIYLTPAMPHVPLYASEQFLGTSDRGLYGDCVEEIDWNVGRLLDLLDREGLSSNTLLIYTSDNGPCLAQGERGGCALPLRDGKFSLYEGGVRVPCVIRWQGVVPEGVVSDAVIKSLDFMPTFAHYAGAEELDLELDGHNISHFLENPDNREGCDEYIYVRHGEVRGVRKGDWVYLPQSGGRGKNEDMPQLFNLKNDISEANNLIEAHPEKVEQLRNIIENYAN